MYVGRFDQLAAVVLDSNSNNTAATLATLLFYASYDLTSRALTSASLKSQR